MHFILLQASSSAASSSGSSQQSLIPTLLMFGLMFIVFYFFMIRPQQKKAKEEKNFHDDLRVGERVVTTGGIHGKLIEVNADTVVLEIMNGKLRLEKNSVSKDLTKLRYPVEVKTIAAESSSKSDAKS